MNRLLRRALPLGALLLGAAGTAFALPPQEGPDSGHGAEEQVKELSRKISRELKENEEALARLARGEKAEPKKVDIELPPDGKQAPPPSPGSGGT